MDDKELAWENVPPSAEVPDFMAQSSAMDTMPEEPAVPVDYHAARKVFSRIGFALAALLVAGSVAQIVAMGVVQGLAPQILENGWVFWAVAMMPMYVVGLPVCLAILPKRTSPAVPGERFGFKRYFPLFFVAFAMMYAGNLVGLAISGLFSGITGISVENPVETLVNLTDIVPMAAMVVVIGPMLEELVFRKLLIDRMRPYGEKLAVVVSALMFGLFHGNLSQMFYAFVLGLLFGYVYLRSGKLRYSIGLHMFINFMGSVVGLVVTNNAVDPEKLVAAAELGDMDAILALLPGFLLLMAYGILVLGLVIAGAVLFFLRWRKTRYDPAPQQLTRGWVFPVVYKNWGMLVFLLGCLGLVVMSLI